MRSGGALGRSHGVVVRTAVLERGSDLAPRIRAVVCPALLLNGWQGWPGRRTADSTTGAALRLSTTFKDLGGEMRTGNAIVDVLIQVVVIAVIAAIIVWILGMVDAPSIVATIVWILAALAIVLVLLQLLRGAAGRPPPRA